MDTPDLAIRMRRAAFNRALADADLAAIGPLLARDVVLVAGTDSAVISGRQGAADTRFLNSYGETPTVIFGPGSTAVMHANDEYVSIDDYLTAIKVMALTIYDWCGAEQ